MSHNDVLKYFKEISPLGDVRIETWYPNGKNSIRLRISEWNTELIFTYNSPRRWRIETVDFFVDNLKMDIGRIKKIKQRNDELNKLRKERMSRNEN